MKRLTRLCICISAALLLTACASSKQETELEQTLRSYGNLIRWSQFQSALNYHAPEWLKEHPVTDLELSRLGLFRITGYEIVSKELSSDADNLRQRARIRLYATRDARERVIYHDQLWRYDQAGKRWLLHAGLPDVTQR